MPAMCLRPSGKARHCTELHPRSLSSPPPIPQTAGRDRSLDTDIAAVTGGTCHVTAMSRPIGSQGPLQTLACR